MNYNEAAEIVMGKLQQVVKVDFTEYHDRSAAFIKEVAKEVGIGIYKYQVVRPEVKRMNSGNFQEHHPALNISFGDKKRTIFRVSIQKAHKTKKRPEGWLIVCPDLTMEEQKPDPYGAKELRHIMVNEVTVENTAAFVRECMIEKMTPVEIATHRMNHGK